MIDVLFTGYAPVHYLCFRPIHRALERDPRFRVTLSGGIKVRDQEGTEHDTERMYAPFEVPASQLATVAELAERDFDVVFAANTKLIAPRRARLKVQLFHGLSFRNRGVREEVLGFDRLFLIGPYMRRRFLELGLLAEGSAQGLPIGFPKTDALLDGSLDRRATLARLGLSGERPVILYAPTGQLHNSLDVMGEEVLGRLDAAGRYDVLLKLHDHPKRGTVDWAARLDELESERIHPVRDLDVIPLLHAADLLITDASSVANEYTLLDRPILFLDVPELIARSAELAGSAQDLATWGRSGGVVVERPEAVVDAVEAALADPAARSPVRRAMAADLFFNPGRAAAAALDWIGEALG